MKSRKEIEKKIIDLDAAEIIRNAEEHHGVYTATDVYLSCDTGEIEYTDCSSGPDNAVHIYRIPRGCPWSGDYSHDDLAAHLDTYAQTSEYFRRVEAGENSEKVLADLGDLDELCWKHYAQEVAENWDAYHYSAEAWDVKEQLNEIYKEESEMKTLEKIFDACAWERKFEHQIPDGGYLHAWHADSYAEVEAAATILPHLEEETAFKALSLHLCSMSRGQMLIVTEDDVVDENGAPRLECVASDGRWTIGYVDGEPAQWPGNNEENPREEDVQTMREDATFGVQCEDEWRVVNGEWKHAEDAEPERVVCRDLDAFGKPYTARYYTRDHVEKIIEDVSVHGLIEGAIEAHNDSYGTTSAYIDCTTGEVEYHCLPSGTCLLRSDELIEIFRIDQNTTASAYVESEDLAGYLDDDETEKYESLVESGMNAIDALEEMKAHDECFWQWFLNFEVEDYDRERYAVKEQLDELYYRIEREAAIDALDEDDE